ncbi:MAG: hypothetical protein H7A38_01680 [Chlamydiales bacterium]|nr:hypothetical protein [Chlamydiales bacterium]
MKKKCLIGRIVLIAFSGLTLSCETNENAKVMHFGPNPIDGDDQNIPNAKEESFGPSPGDDLTDEAIHFGPGPGDG